MRLTNTIPHTCSRCTREPFGQSTSALPPHALPQGPCGTNLYDLNRTFYMPFPELFSALGHRRHLATGRSPPTTDPEQAAAAIPRRKENSSRDSAQAPTRREWTYEWRRSSRPTCQTFHTLHQENGGYSTKHPLPP